MRVPFKGDNYFCTQINTAFNNLERTYLDTISSAITMKKTSAMLGDGTVTQVDTFDPRNVQLFYERLPSLLKTWEFTGISRSATEDLHRLYCHVTKEVGKFSMNGYFGIQFHVLPYYKVDRRVIEIQKELSKIADDATSVFKEMTAKADSALASELEKRGYADLDSQELFSKMFDDEKLAKELDKKATDVESQFPEFEEMGMRKTKLFAELNGLLIELYQTSSVLIDYNRLMQGEEGVTTYFDIEVIKNKKTKAREPYLNTSIIRNDAVDELVGELAEVKKALKLIIQS